MIAEHISHFNGIYNHIFLGFVTVVEAHPLGTGNVNPLGLVRVVTLFLTLPGSSYEGTLPSWTELAAYVQWFVP